MFAGEVRVAGLSAQRTTIYVKLLEEGTDAWRPVDARRVAGSQFVITTPRPDGEVWEFETGSMVQCEQRRLQDGLFDVAIQLAP